MRLNCHRSVDGHSRCLVCSCWRIALYWRDKYHCGNPAVSDRWRHCSDRRCHHYHIQHWRTWHCVDNFVPIAPAGNSVFDCRSKTHRHTDCRWYSFRYNCLSRTRVNGIAQMYCKPACLSDHNSHLAHSFETDTLYLGCTHCCCLKRVGNVCCWFRSRYDPLRNRCLGYMPDNNNLRHRCCCGIDWRCHTVQFASNRKNHRRCRCCCGNLAPTYMLNHWACHSVRRMRTNRIDIGHLPGSFPR